MGSARSTATLRSLALLSLGLASGIGTPATAQVVAPGGASPGSLPPVPAIPDRVGGQGPTPATVEQLAERLRAIEERNRQLTEELIRTRAEHAEQLRMILERLDGRGPIPGPPGVGPTEEITPPTPKPSTPIASPEPIDLGGTDNPVPDYTEDQIPPYRPPEGYQPWRLRPDGRTPLGASFGPGFELATEDEEYRLVVHYESQIEARIWGQSDQQPPNSGFYMPRQRIFFSGNITKPVEYDFAINRGFGSLNILNAYINLHPDDRFQLRIGRFFTPMPYDQYAISNYWLPTPERSLFTTNLSLARQIGLMGWGYLFDKRLDYAAGVFNGSRNSFEPLSRGVDFVGYLNGRPFQESPNLPFLRFLNVGSSVAYGNQDQSPVPLAFRIAGGSANADVPGAGTVPFLILNRDVVERGERLLGSVHAAYFYRGLSLLGEWQYGHAAYGSLLRPGSASVPFHGYYLTGAYFLTGEEVERRSRIRPLRPVLTTGKDRARRGIGAWEVVGRVSQLRLGDQVFSAGLSDPNLWSNRATTAEAGLNWYLNEYIKIYMFWLHGEFDSPVLYRPGEFQRTADMFWLRFQLYF